MRILVLFTIIVLAAGAWLFLRVGPGGTEPDVVSTDGSIDEDAEEEVPGDDAEPTIAPPSGSADVGADAPAGTESVAEPRTVRPAVDREQADGAYDGQVFDRDGRPLEGVQVLAFVPGPNGIGGRVVAHTLTDAGGRYVLQVPPREQSLIKLDAVGDGFRLSRTTPDRRRNDFRLEPIRAASIEGRVIDPRGRPLSPAELSRHFPDVAEPFEVKRGVASYPIDPAESGVFAVATTPEGDVEVRGTIRPEGGAFRIDNPPFHDGAVVLRYHGLELARRSWSVGSEEVVFLVNVAELRGALGTLSVRAAAATEVQVERVGRERAAPPRFELVDGEVEVQDVPPGTYRVSRGPSDDGRSPVEVTIAAGANRRVELE